MIKKALVFFLLNGLIFAAQAQESWSLQRCVDYALENNIQIKQAELDAEIAEVQLFGSRMASLPSLNANASYNISTGRSIDPFTNVIIDRELTSQSMGITASVPIFNGFRIRNSTMRDKEGLLASEYDLEARENDIILNVVTFYTNILFNVELLQAAELRLQTTEAQENRIAVQVELGAVALGDLLQIRQQLANDELQVITAENNIALSKLQLKQALQLAADVDFAIDTPDLPQPDSTSMVETSNQIYLYALQHQPIIKAAQARKESSYHGIGVARSDYYPSLSFVAGLSTSYSSAAPERLPVAGTESDSITTPIGIVNIDGVPVQVSQQIAIPRETEKNTYWNQLNINQRRFVGLQLNIPIFNQFQVRNNVQRAFISQKRADYQLLDAKNQLQQTIEQAYLDVKTAAKAYSALEKSLRASELTFNNAEQQLELGATNTVEYTQIKNNFEQVKSDLIRAKYDYIFKSKVLDFYQGKPLNF